jgi:methylisocitrate lyase
MSTPGALFRAAVAANRPLQVLGTINAYAAVQAEKEGA